MSKLIKDILFPPVAQLVERRAYTSVVLGSSPSGRTTKEKFGVLTSSSLKLLAAVLDYNLTIVSKTIFKNDKYKKTRGRYSRLLEISCEKCGNGICKYQKDGPGNLRRMYHDRIMEPTVSILRKDLSCPKGHLLGVKIIYDKEERLAFRLFVDSVTKKIVKS